MPDPYVLHLTLIPTMGLASSLQCHEARRTGQACIAMQPCALPPSTVCMCRLAHQAACHLSHAPETCWLACNNRSRSPAAAAEAWPRLPQAAAAAADPPSHPPSLNPHASHPTPPCCSTPACSTLQRSRAQALPAWLDCSRCPPPGAATLAAAYCRHHSSSSSRRWCSSQMGGHMVTMTHAPSRRPGESQR